MFDTSAWINLPGWTSAAPNSPHFLAWLPESSLGLSWLSRLQFTLQSGHGMVPICVWNSDLYVCAIFSFNGEHAKHGTYDSFYGVYCMSLFEHMVP